MQPQFKAITISSQKEIALNQVCGTRPAIQGSMEVVTTGGIIALNSAKEIETFQTAYAAYKEDHQSKSERPVAPAKPKDKLDALTQE